MIGEITKEFSKGNPVIVPTDTIYGFASPIGNKECIERIFDLKERPKKMTLPVAVGDVNSIATISEPTEIMIDTMKENLPGPITYVLPSKEGMSDLIVRKGTVAVRVPEHPLFRIICDISGPLALTSANIHGRDVIQSFEDAVEQFENENILMIEDPSSLCDVASDIIDLTGTEPMLLRKGNTLTQPKRGHEHGRR